MLHTVDRDEPARLERLSPEQLERVSKEETQYQITVMEERIEQLKPNMAAIEAYHRKVSGHRPGEARRAMSRRRSTWKLITLNCFYYFQLNNIMLNMIIVNVII